MLHFELKCRVVTIIDREWGLLLDKQEVGKMDETQKLSISEMNREVAQTILDDVYLALEEKGYNPVTQIVGYIMSGDPSYITSHRNARALIRKMERDELLEELVKVYAENRLKSEN